MNDPFTINGSNFQTMEKLEELRRAYSERSKFAGLGWKKYIWMPEGAYQWVDGDGTENDTLQSNTPSHGKGFNLQSAEFWIWPQVLFVGIESYAWLEDDYQKPSGVTFREFCERAGGGLYSPATDEKPEEWGFRRVTEYGEDGKPIFIRCNDLSGVNFVSPGDILGYWLIEDLISAYSVPLVFGLTESNSPFQVSITSSTWEPGPQQPQGTWQAAVQKLCETPETKTQPTGVIPSGGYVTMYLGLIFGAIPWTPADWWNTTIFLSSRSEAVTTPGNDVGDFFLKAYAESRCYASGAYTENDVSCPLVAGWQQLPASFSSLNDGNPPKRIPDPSPFSDGWATHWEADVATSYSIFEPVPFSFRLFFNFTNIGRPTS